MNTEELSGIIRAYLGTLLADYREAHWNAKPHRSVFTGKVPADEDPIDHDIEHASDQIATLREALARREASFAKGTVDELMASNGIPADYRSTVLEGVIAANIEALKIARLRLLGRLEGTIFSTKAGGSPLSVPVSAAIGVHLSALIPDFEAEMTRGEKPQWDAHTAGQNKNTLARFVEICGDRAPAAYSLRDITRFLDTMEQLPNTYGKSNKDKTLTVAQLIERAKANDIKRLARGTIERHKATISRLFTFLVQREHRQNNPVSDHQFMRSEAPEKRRPWSSDQLKTFFLSPFYTGARSEERRALPGSHIYWDHYYWLPLLGLYHGNRLEEFAQLRREDVIQDNGISYLRITDEDGRRIKNEPSRRRVPLHAKLIELGFLDYVAQVAPSPACQLFPCLQPGGKGNKLGHYFSRRFTEYRRQLGMYQELRDYHSFRHGVETKLAGLGDVPDRFIDILLGHQGVGTGRAIYLDRGEIPIAQLSAIVQRIEFPEVQVKRAISPIVLTQKFEAE